MTYEYAVLVGSGIATALVAMKLMGGRGITANPNLSALGKKVQKAGEWLKYKDGYHRFRYEGMVYGEVFDRRWEGSSSPSRYAVSDGEVDFEKLVDAKKWVIEEETIPGLRRDGYLVGDNLLGRNPAEYGTLLERMDAALTSRDAAAVGKIAETLRFRYGMNYNNIFNIFKKAHPSLTLADYDALLEEVDSLEDK